MPATVDTNIWLALRGRLEGLVQTPAVPLVWPGEAVTLPTGTCLEVMHLINRPRRLYLNGSEPSFRTGILQVGVLTMPGAAGHQNLAIELAGKVAAHFPAGFKMSREGVVVRVSEAPAIGTSYRDTQRSRWVTPVSIRYQAEA